MALRRAHASTTIAVGDELRRHRLGCRRRSNRTPNVREGGPAKKMRCRARARRHPSLPARWSPGSHLCRTAGIGSAKDSSRDGARTSRGRSLWRRARAGRRLTDLRGRAHWRARAGRRVTAERGKRQECGEACDPPVHGASNPARAQFMSGADGCGRSFLRFFRNNSSTSGKLPWPGKNSSVSPSAAGQVRLWKHVEG